MAVVVVVVVVMMTVMMMHAVCSDINQWSAGSWSIRSSERLRQLLLLILFTASLQCNFLQMETLSLWIYGLLLISLTRAQQLNHFPEVVGAKWKDSNPVTLTCRTKTDGDVTWKFEGDEMGDDDYDENIQRNGQDLSVSMVENPMLGEYSCWRGSEMLSSTYLLLKKDESNNFPIKCRAKSYDCNFSCDWTHSTQRAVRLGLGHDCREGRESCHWVSSVQPVKGKFHFNLSHSLSPYAEESTMLELTAEAITTDSILRGTKSFYLRDIIQPDSPQIVKCQEEEENVNVTIDAPQSWSTPQSFFTLEHQIEYVLRDDGTSGFSSTALIPKGVSKLRARSRDSLVPSNWSQWTPWKNVITGKKNLCKCKNTEKSCCPELPSGYLDNCKKRREKKKNKDAKRSQTS